jgi:hypothetical protein
MYGSPSILFVSGVASVCYLGSVVLHVWVEGEESGEDYSKFFLRQCHFICLMAVIAFTELGSTPYSNPKYVLT